MKKMLQKVSVLS